MGCLKQCLKQEQKLYLGVMLKAGADVHEPGLGLPKGGALL